MYKLPVLLFVTAVLIFSFATSGLPSAKALTARTDFSDRHSSASYGNSRICGDHICAPGEQTEWEMKISAAQRGGIQNLSKLRNYTQLNGEDVMHKIVGSTAAPNTMHGTIKMTEKPSMGGNMTGSGNTTNGTK